MHGVHNGRGLGLRIRGWGLGGSLALPRCNGLLGTAADGGDFGGVSRGLLQLGGQFFVR